MCVLCIYPAVFLSCGWDLVYSWGCSSRGPFVVVRGLAEATAHLFALQMCTKWAAVPGTLNTTWLLATWRHSVIVYSLNCPPCSVIYGSLTLTNEKWPFVHLFLVKKFLYIVPNYHQVLSLHYSFSIPFFCPTRKISFSCHLSSLDFYQLSKLFPPSWLVKGNASPYIRYIRFETKACQALLMDPKAASKRLTRTTSSSWDDPWLLGLIWLKRTAILLCNLTSMVENRMD